MALKSLGAQLTRERLTNLIHRNDGPLRREGLPADKVPIHFASMSVHSSVLSRD